ncbi:hypothetical protein RIF29_29777 [Crotalaria pallida]|uniref:Uncharacterized protein n=1 Tax=Crotalaria pallida TaxID=3830 RepID=A0AAN9EKC2_CROPI
MATNLPSPISKTKASWTMISKKKMAMNGVAANGQTPVYDNNDSKSKPRKRLIKKSGGDSGKASVAPPELFDEVEEEENNVGRFSREGNEDRDARKRKKGKEVARKKKEKRQKGEKRLGGSGGGGGGGGGFDM